MCIRVQDMVAAASANLSSGAPLLLTVDEAAIRLRLHRSRLYPLMASGELEFVKIGKSRRVPYASLEAYIARLLAEQGRGA